jgi:ketosteroid isomerase-like protein
MGGSRDTDGSWLAGTLALVMALALMGGGATVFMWQRQKAMMQQQEAIVQSERAAAEAARARAVADQRQAETSRAETTPAESPNGEDAKSIEDLVRKVLQTQQRAWNAGDIDRFMESYWNSEDLTFSSGGKVTRTWQGTLENYKERYPTLSDMGKLSFLNLEVTPLGTQAASVLGEWHLSREAEDLGGIFTLVFRRMGEQWVIVHDHTSRTVEP